MAPFGDRTQWPVRTARLLIRPAEPRDVTALWEMRRLDSVSRWLTRAPQTIEEYRLFAGTEESLARTLVIELDGRIIGELMIAIRDGWAQAERVGEAVGVQAELGWVLHPDLTGQGYATEAVREAMRICFEDLGLRRVTAVCFADNEASWRLMERVGMRREGHAVRDSLHRSGVWLDGLSYALLADEWESLTRRRG